MYLKKSNLMIFILLIGAGCSDSGTIQCVTRCYLRYMGNPDFSFNSEVTCPQFQRAEDRAIKIFEEIVVGDERFEDVCSRISGWKVISQPYRSWGRVSVDGGVKTVSGVTYCHPIYGAEINNEPIESGSLMHELAHIIQQCNARPTIGDVDVEHANWHSTHIFDALDTW